MRQDLRSFDDVSLGSPAATVITIDSSQATYNTNNLLVQPNNEAHQLSASQPKIMKE